MNKIYFFPFAILLLPACGSKENAGVPNGKITVGLEEASGADGCFNLPNYLRGVRAMGPSLAVREISTDLQIKAKSGVRENFRRMLAYGTTLAESRPLGEVGDFPNVSQEACSAITVTDPDGATATYPIVSAGKESLKAESEDGLGFEYTWLGPTRMRITQRYQAYDLPCGTDKPLTVVHTKELDWSGSAPDSVSVSPELVRLVAETVGADPAEAAAGEGNISVEKLQGLLSRDPRPEYLTCNGQLPGPPPVPTPEPVPAPNDPAPSPSDPATPENPADPGEPMPGDSSGRSGSRPAVPDWWPWP